MFSFQLKGDFRMSRIGSQKKAKTSGGGQSLTGETSTTLSARFDAREVQRLEAAAQSKQWSVAQLIRAGAVEKSINMQNSIGRVRLAVDSFIAELLKQLLDPNVELFGSPEDVDEVSKHMEQCDVSADPDRFSESGVLSLIKIVRSLGSEFATILEEAYQRKMHTASATLADLVDPAALDAPSALGGAGPAPGVSTNLNLGENR